MKKGNLSTLNETTVALWWMEEMILLTSPSANQAFTHLLTAQWEDGSWDDSQITWAVDCLSNGGLPKNHLYH